MAKTSVYGLPYEMDTDVPGSSVRADGVGDTLAEAVETQLSRIDAAMQGVEDRLELLELTVVGSRSVTPNDPVADYFRGTETVQLPPGLFATTPRIQVSAHSSVPGTLKEATFNNPTKDSFDIVIARTTTTATNVHWQATGAVSPTGPSPAWVDVPLSSGAIDGGAGNSLHQARQLDTGQIEMQLDVDTGAVAASGDIIATLPVGYRPGPQLRHQPATSNGYSGELHLDISADGACKLWFSAAAAPSWIALVTVFTP